MMSAFDVPRCSIVIRAFNEERHIGRLLTGILKQTVRDLEIILVDSGSTDATRSIASRYPVRILQISPERFSFGRSLNIGIENARGEQIVIASAHVYPVYPDWLARLLAPFEDPQIALAYGKQRGNAATKFSEIQHFAKTFPDRSHHRQEHPFCNNANAAVRRSLWQRHPYDENLSGLEDLEWATWALDQGYHLAYVAEAEVVHAHNEGPRQVYNRYRREAMALKRIRSDMRFHFWDLMRLYAMNVVSDLWHALRRGVLPRVMWSVLWFRWMQFWGTYRGFAHTGPLTKELMRAFWYPRGLQPAVSRAGRDLSPIDYREAFEEDPFDLPLAADPPELRDR